MNNVYAPFRRASKILAVLLVASPVLLFSGRAAAQQPGNAVARPVASSSAANDRAPNYVELDAKPAAKEDASHEGFKLHGHWVIDVLNPDHSLAHRHDFENALDPSSGAEILLGLLSGYYASGNPAITLFGNGNPGSPCLPANYQGGIDYCEIVKSTSVEPGSTDCVNSGYNFSNLFACAATLTVTYNPTSYTYSSTYPFSITGTIPASLVLAGSITANSAGTISAVSTGWSVCQSTSTSTPTTTSASSCQALTTYGGTNGDGSLSLSGTSPGTITVASGQIIQVTITFTIS